MELVLKCMTPWWKQSSNTFIMRNSHAHIKIKNENQRTRVQTIAKHKKNKNEKHARQQYVKLACGCEKQKQQMSQNMQNLHAAVVFSKVHSLNSRANIFSASTYFDPPRET